MERRGEERRGGERKGGRHVYKLVYLLYREISAKASIVHVTVAFNVPPYCTESS